MITTRTKEQEQEDEQRLGPKIQKCKAQNFGQWQSLAIGYAHTHYSPKSYRPSTQAIPLCALVYPKFSIGVLGGGCEPILEKRRP